METKAEALPTPNPRPWQFGLREMLILVFVVSAWCTVANWSLLSAIFLGTWVLSVYLLAWFVKRRQARVSVIEWFAIIAATGILCPLSISPYILSQRPYAEATVELVLKDELTDHPLANVEVYMKPNGIISSEVSSTTNVDGRASLRAFFRQTNQEIGWGRYRHELTFDRTDFIIYAPGYDPTVVRWEDLSKVNSWSVDTFSPPPMVIKLKPASVQATH